MKTAYRTLLLLLVAVMAFACNIDETYTGPDDEDSPYQTRVIEFLPAPGQFINEYKGKEEGYSVAAMDEACEYALGQLNKGGSCISLGGFGGYVVVGFDHSIENVEGYDFAIGGNAIVTSSEPGIVWVMRADDGSGEPEPDGTWYELRGSEYDAETTKRNYEVTYYRPSAPQMAVEWTDSEGNSGTIDYRGDHNHTQDYYYPQWVSEDSYTLSGTCLGLRNSQNEQTTWWENAAYDWGYADNYGSDRTAEGYKLVMANYFDIENAVDADGKPVLLDRIDFIKVQTGVNGKSGPLGEISTEVFYFVDLSLIDKE